MTQTHFRTCNLCEAMCGIAVEHRGGQILSIKGDADDPFSRGHICPKAVGLKDIHEDPDRLRHPQKRVGDSWERIGWEQAFDEVAAGIRRVQERHGGSAIALYQGNPTVHNLGAMTYGQLFVRAVRTRQKYSATSLDQLPHMLAGLEMFGHQLLLPVPDIDRTNYLLVFGANPLASNGSLMSAPDVARRLKAIKKRGGKIVVVDPRRSETAELADQHVFVRPGADALLLMALLNVVLVEQPELSNLGRLESCIDGLTKLKANLDGFGPDAVADATGVDADTIRSIAKDFARASSAVCYGRIGICTQEFGGLSAWLVNVLNIVTGNFDRPGGAMFTTPAVDFVAVAAKLGEKGHFDRRRTRVRNLPEFGGEFPAAALAEEMDTPGEGQVRGLITSAGNPVLSAPNGRRLEKALEDLEFMVSIDIYRNETTRHAHYILPPTFGVENSHYDVAFSLLTIRNTAKYSPRLVERTADTRYDWEIYLELATRLKNRTPVERGSSMLTKALMSRTGPETLIDLMLRTGPYGGGLNPMQDGLTLRKLRDNPHGIDLGPLKPVMPERVMTSDGRIHLAPQIFVDDVPRLKKRLGRPAEIPTSAESQLSLIGRRQLRSNNSWMHNSHRLVKGKVRCTLMMHPEDASVRGFADGQTVRVTSRVGEVEAPLEVTDEVMRGVVSLPHGWGHNRPGIQLTVAEAHAGVSINDLTDEQEVDVLSGNIRFSDVPVRVTAA